MGLKSLRKSGAPYGRHSSAIEKQLLELGSPSEVLRRHGIPVRGKTAVCPFHDDHTPSLGLYKGKDGRERWRCFTCNMGGDSIDLDKALRNQR